MSIGLSHSVSGSMASPTGQRPATVELIYTAVAADLDAVYDQYRRAGLFTDGGSGSRAWTLLGGSEEAERFRREALLLNAVLRHRVARLVFDKCGLRHVVLFGGNNVGKSTIVNILAAASVASTSPEGGHNRHAHAFTAAP